MAVRYELGDSGLADVRFALSPLNELVLSLRAWRDPGRYPLMLPWLRSTDQARRILDHEALLALINPQLWTPDTLIPRPHSPMTQIYDELSIVANVDAEVLARELEELHGSSAYLEKFGTPARLQSRAIAALRDYWDTCFEMHWPRMRGLLEADVVFRAREMSRHGMGHMLDDLDRNVSFAHNAVTVRLNSGDSYSRSTGDAGLTLVPTIFSTTASTPSSADQTPMIHYTVRGLGTLWQPATRPSTAALVTLLGRPRARLLTMLRKPASSTELAVTLDVTTSAVNQHLRALHAAGLLIASRSGRAVLYRRSDLGDQLVAGRR